MAKDEKENKNQTGGVRINKYLASLGICSRREADAYIADGRISINGQTAELGSKVTEQDEIRIDGKTVQKTRPDLIYIALNKPVGVTSTTDRRDPTNIIDFMDYPERIFPIGRLDKDSDGLIILTNDGDIVNYLLRARYSHEKEYEVTVDQDITPDFIEGMSGPVPILDTVTNPSKVRQIDRRRFRIVLTQGLNRQIRRMAEYFGYTVVRLTRWRIMNITLGNLREGEWRYITPKEVDQLQDLLRRRISEVDGEMASESLNQAEDYGE